MKRKQNLSFPWHRIVIHSLIALVLLVTTYFIPEHVLEPFLGIDLKKIIKIILSLGAIQFIGIALLKYLNSQAGVVIHGFISGLISSTAFTVTLAKKSHTMTTAQKSVESLGFLSATLAMLTQGLFLAIITAPNLPSKTMSLFIGPMLVTVALMIRRSIHTSELSLPKEKSNFNWSTIFKLALFICIILSISQHAQKWAGDLGMQLVTFIVSLFEAHGSIVASAQLYNSQQINAIHLDSLIFISIIASYISKLVIVYITGHNYLKRKITLWSTAIIFSLILAYWL